MKGALAMDEYEVVPEEKTIPAGTYKLQQKMSLAYIVLGGLGLGLIPGGITALYTVVVLKVFPSNPAWACHNLMTGTTGFLWVSPAMLVTAIICLFFKRVRISGVIAILVWALTILPAFICFVLMAFSSDGCMPYVFR
jgi:hypothetical protein